MKDTSHLAKAMREEVMSKFFTAALLTTALAAEAQAQETKVQEASKQTQTTEVSVNTADAINKSGATATIGSGAIISLTSNKDATDGKNGTAFYADLTPNFEGKLTNAHGDYAKFSAMESLILDNKDYNATTIKFMIELGKEIGDGSTIFFKAGRESTEAGSVYDVAMHQYADAQNIVTFGNLSDVMAFGYTKNGIKAELGIIGSTDDGLYVIPNPKYASFWAKGGISLLQKSGVELYMDGATRLGHGHQDILGSLGIKTHGFKARALGKYDFVERSGALGADLAKDLKNGWKIMAGTVLKDKGNEFRLHCGVDKNDVQFSVEYARQKNQPSTVNFTVATHLARSKTMSTK